MTDIGRLGLILSTFVLGSFFELRPTSSEMLKDVQAGLIKFYQHTSKPRIGRDYKVELFSEECQEEKSFWNLGRGFVRNPKEVD